MIDPTRIAIAVDVAKNSSLNPSGFTASEILTSWQLAMPLADVQRVLNVYMDIAYQVADYEAGN